MAMHHDLKQRMLALLDPIPDATLQELAMFLDYQQYKLGRRAPGTPYTPVPLGGVWAGIEVSDEDLAETRSDMWGHFGEREL